VPNVPIPNQIFFVIETVSRPRVAPYIVDAEGEEVRRLLAGASGEHRHLALTLAADFGHVEIVRSSGRGIAFCGQKKRLCDN
jgi:hypothetical protein